MAADRHQDYLLRASQGNVKARVYHLPDSNRLHVRLQRRRPKGPLWIGPYVADDRQLPAAGTRLIGAEPNVLQELVQPGAVS